VVEEEEEEEEEDEDEDEDEDEEVVVVEVMTLDVEPVRPRAKVWFNWRHPSLIRLTVFLG
jgi:hypothetical protein